MKLIFILLASFVGVVASQRCVTHTDCRECLSRGVMCSWVVLRGTRTGSCIRKEDFGNFHVKLTYRTLAFCRRYDTYLDMFSVQKSPPGLKENYEGNRTLEKPLWLRSSLESPVVANQTTPTPLTPSSLKPSTTTTLATTPTTPSTLNNKTTTPASTPTTPTTPITTPTTTENLKTNPTTPTTPTTNPTTPTTPTTTQTTPTTPTTTQTTPTTPSSPTTPTTSTTTTPTTPATPTTTQTTPTTQTTTPATPTTSPTTPITPTMTPTTPITPTTTPTTPTTLMTTTPTTLTTPLTLPTTPTIPSTSTIHATNLTTTPTFPTTTTPTTIMTPKASLTIPNNLDTVQAIPLTPNPSPASNSIKKAVENSSTRIINYFDSAGPRPNSNISRTGFWNSFDGGEKVEILQPDQAGVRINYSSTISCQGWVKTVDTKFLADVCRALRSGQRKVINHGNRRLLNWLLDCPITDSFDFCTEHLYKARNC